MNGSCRFGDSCNYRHERPRLPATQVCRYFQKGGCWFGESCRYRHVVTCGPGAAGSPGRSSASPSEAEAAHPQREPYPDSSSRLLLESSSEGTSNARVVSSRVEGAAAAAHTQSISQDAVLQSRDLTCGICMETVSEKLDPRHQMFGILPNCTHSFCLQCIMTWRKTKDLGTDVVKTCPQCRVRSPFYVPNKYWVEGAAKESLIVSFKKKFSRKSCSYYARYRCCPFKTECLYRHDKRLPHRTLQFSSDDEDEDFFDGIDLINFVMMSLFVTDEDLDLSSFDSEDFA
ncbi:makorin, ring finger protein, 4 [Synchiropus splendidus]|uniref:makorin, ring finger protein, 4 n=1 Tax=Synchiropus splendidus TaxID=270530 RepID=UPI00237E33AA|nr:makorin, ring finger protein, 4 [Synchiropus splendidus]